MHNNELLTDCVPKRSCLLVANIISLIYDTAKFILLIYTHPFTDKLLCDATSPSSICDFKVLYSVEVFVAVLGSCLIFVPYIGFGLCTMFVILWRLLKGKTGYRTHFHVQLNAPLI